MGEILQFVLVAISEDGVLVVDQAVLALENLGCESLLGFSLQGESGAISASGDDVDVRVGDIVGYGEARPLGLQRVSRWLCRVV